MSLRDALLIGLKQLPGKRAFRVHVLVSSPKKHSDLFPFAQPRPRSYLQEILILVSEQSSPSSHFVFVTAVESYLYIVPSTSSAILYVAKVDSTGQALSPSPTTTIVKSLLLYYADPTTSPLSVDHVWIHVFARSQSQYLFPNSADFERKKPLSDRALCGWWKKLLSSVADVLDGKTKILRLHYILPGYSQAEAEHSLSPSSSSVPLTYGHPYSQSDIPLPCPPSQKLNLGHFIPSFEDDPKSRFIDDLAYTTAADAVASPAPKRQRTSSSSHADVKPKSESHHPLGELGKITPDEYWEQMSFRQECVAGAVTGFFTIGLTRENKASLSFAPQPGEVSAGLKRRVLTALMQGVEFSTVEYAVHGTETVENAIRGLCEGSTVFAPPAPAPAPIAVKLSTREGTPPRTTYLSLPPVTPPRHRHIPDISPNPFPDPETSLEMYNAYVYGLVEVDNPIIEKKVEEKKEPTVTVLVARKKKKV